MGRPTYSKLSGGGEDYAILGKKMVLSGSEVVAAIPIFSRFCFPEFSLHEEFTDGLCPKTHTVVIAVFSVFRQLWLCEADFLLFSPHSFTQAPELKCPGFLDGCVREYSLLRWESFPVQSITFPLKLFTHFPQVPLRTYLRAYPPGSWLSMGGTGGKVINPNA